MPHAVDCAIVGGGVIGLTTAWFLAEAGQRVLVCEQGEIGREASWAGAGIVPPGNFARATTPYDRLRAYGAERFAEVSAQLREQTGIDNGYRRCGGIEFLPAEAAEELTQPWCQEAIAFERLTTAELQQRFPTIHPPDAAAYWLPDLAQVRNPWHLRALRTRCEQIGVTFRPHDAVVGFERTATRVTALRLANEQRIVAERFLIASGAWTDGLLAEFGIQLGVRPVLGQIVLVRLPQPPCRPILLAGKCYVVPRDDGRTLIGSTEEPEAGFTKRTTAEARRQLLQFGTGLLPQLAEGEVETTWAGLRPGSPDGMPFLGLLPGYGNAWVAAGHFRAGIQLSIGTATLLTDLLLDRPALIDSQAFRLDRCPQTDFRPAFRS